MTSVASEGTKRRGVARLLAFLGAPLLAASVSIVLSATPAHASLVFHGTFTIETAGGCAQVQNNGTTNKTPIQLAPCNGSAAQRWAIFRDTDNRQYWILAYGGAQPLNMCMDKGDSSIIGHMWIYGCHGGSQQRWFLEFDTFPVPQQIGSVWDAFKCVGFTLPATSTLALRTCDVDGDGDAPEWTLRAA